MLPRAILRRNGTSREQPGTSLQTGEPAIALGWARLEAPVCFFVADREADFDTDFSGVFRLLLGWEVSSLLVRAIAILSSAGAASRPHRGTAFLRDDNDGVAVRFARKKGDGELGPAQELSQTEDRAPSHEMRPTHRWQS